MRSGLIAAVAAAATLTLVAAPAEAAPSTWYVSADATTSAGTRSQPFATLYQAQEASRAGDTIVVVSSARPLDDGIRLKPRQTLQGDGNGSSLLTNTTDHLAGDAVRLADGTTVRGLRIVDPRRGGIYGEDVTGVRVTGNDVSGQNASCADGFLIPQFNAPTSLPGIGIPIAGGLQNGWAGIAVDATTRQGLTALIDRNVVHDAECGDGIDARFSGAATGTVRIEHNDVHSLRQGPRFKSVLAIGLQSRDEAHLTAVIDHNTQANLGNDDDLNLAVEGADSEGVFLNAVGPGRLDATVSHNTYTNEKGIGGFSANGLEMVSMGQGARMNAVIRDSRFSGSPGDVIEHGALGTDAVMTMTLERVTAERSTGIGNTYVLPFNNGDCVLAGSLGARNTVRLYVRDSALRNCSNNGLSLGSNVVNGSGPTTELTAEISDTTITGNRGGNLGVRNFTRLDRLSLKVERSNLQRSTSLGSGIADFSAEDLGATGQATIDLGGGELGSEGNNCMVGGLLAAQVVRYRVAAQHNWWGRAGGPGLLRTNVLLGGLATQSPLTEAPRHCR